MGRGRGQRTHPTGMSRRRDGEVLGELAEDLGTDMHTGGEEGEGTTHPGG